MSELPPFEMRPECRKCGNDRMLLRYVSAETDTERVKASQLGMIGDRYDAPSPYMEVTCERCRFKWAMQAKDGAE